MKAYVIKIAGQESGVERLKRSIKDFDCNVRLEIFDGTIPDTISQDLHTFKYYDGSKFRWTWPTDPSQNKIDMKSGLYKFYYEAANQQKKVACTISHMRLWDKCVTDNEPMIILEADAIFSRRFNVEEVRGTTICGLNDPRGATRRAQDYHVQASYVSGARPVPTVNRPDEPPMPQGIAGNSAYYITPEGAKAMLDLVTEHGAWPNDAIMCKELYPKLRQIYPYMTRVIVTESTTTR